MAQNCSLIGSSPGVRTEASSCVTSNRANQAQNGIIERFNQTYRTEVLSAYVFESLDQVREISAEWLQSYNDERPHDVLAGVPPATVRAQLNAGSSPLPVSR
jgi:transposase InsO family protein